MKITEIFVFNKLEISFSWFLGNNPAFEVPEYNLVSPVELIPYAILGIIAGLVALMFIKTLYSIEDYFDEKVIEAYWLGNSLLDKVKSKDLKNITFNR